MLAQAAASSTDYEPGTWTCASTTGSSKVGIAVVNYAGAVVSTTCDAACAGGVYTWTAKLDKEKYLEGEIAVLTIEAKDSTGAPVNDFATTGAGATAVGLNLSPVEYNGIGVNSIAGAVFDGGKVKFDYLVLPLASSQQFIKSRMVVSLPAYTSSAQASQTTVPYEINDADPSAKTILIVGERGTVSGKPGIVVDGSTTGFDSGATVKPFVRFPGQTSYSEGSARPKISAVGDFEWQRKTGKKTYVYFTSDDGAVQSNRVIIDAK